MRIPEDWDSPGWDNDVLCARFLRDVYDCGERRMPYRLYVPDADERTWETVRDAAGHAGCTKTDVAGAQAKCTSSPALPLVVYLHGADAIGKDNESHLSMHDIGTHLAREEWQKQHPCFILAPQYDHGMHWASEGMPENLHGLILDVAGSFPDIDMHRIYLYGYSAGGIGALRNIKTFPKFFAAAIVICGATAEDALDTLTNTPLWLFHAADDLIVPIGDRLFAPSKSGYFGSRPLYRYLKERMDGSALHYTEYPKGELKRRYGINPHCAWVPATEATEAWEWMFAQSREKNF